MLCLLITMIATVNTLANGQWLTFDSREYFFGTDLVNYTVAKKRCSNKTEVQTLLAVIYTEKIQAFLQNTIKKRLSGEINFFGHQKDAIAAM